MRHYYSPLYRQVTDPVQPLSTPQAPVGLRRERVPALIDALDCLLALWVAEATLNGGARETGETCSPDTTVAGARGGAHLEQA